MNQTSEPDSSIVISYLTLRKTIGWLGISLPFLLVLGAWLIFQEKDIRSSISAYYYSDMGDVFVGTLCAIGFFLFSYKGYERRDDIAGDVACVLAVGAALFPTAPVPIPPDEGASCYGGQIGYCPHGFFAASFFLMLAYFCLFLFTKTDPNKPPSRRKLKRNAVYRACGYTMLSCILLVPFIYLLPDNITAAIEKYDPVFWLETVAVLAFSVSWLTKGEAILKDES